MALLLAACAAKAPMPDTPDLRNPTVPLGGTSRFEADRFAGDWVTVGCLGRCAASESYTVATGGVLLRAADGAQTAYRISAPGILRQIGEDATLVVMWVDEGFRTAAIGDADGHWAAILNRSRAPAPDRLEAARQILDFNGWDIARLRPVGG